MITSIRGQLADWNYARGNTIRFLEQLSNEDLHKTLPRKTFDTFFKQIAEMAWVQRCFVKAIEQKTMDGLDWVLPAYESKEELLGQMLQFDQEMQHVLETCDGTEEVDWYGEVKNINEHVSSLQSHEMMHLGQMIAFCHALDIKIPQDVTQSMHLTGS